MKPSTITIGAAILAITATGASHAQDGFWERLSALCGQAHGGELIRAPEGDTTFEGRALVMHVRDCTPDRIRIPFVAGDDLSRTWVLTRHEDGRIELRHDHRHDDGTDEDVTMYGGFSPSEGGPHGRIFPADDQTNTVIPGSWPNVWMMEVHPGERFVYFVQRLGTERAFRVEFDLSQEVDAPPAPWGWED
ncbi:hypothetical protein [Glycocaulis sp.]|mgnify:CR=1 FL=1